MSQARKKLTKCWKKSKHFEEKKHYYAKGGMYVII